MDMPFTQEQIREVFDYNAELGVLVWKKCQRADCIGTIAGTIHGNGYSSVTLFGKRHYVHKVIWLFVHGTWPAVIDHIDENPTNNRLDNLREATHSQNHANYTRRANGVTKHGRKFRARIMKDYVQRYIGSYDTREEAEEAYKQEHIRVFGEFSIFTRK